MLSAACSSMHMMPMKKNKTMLSLFSLLPEEIIIDEILLNLPMISLLHLRCVSRYFRSLITSRSFLRRYHDHNSTTDDLLLITCRRNDGRRRNKEVYKHYSCNFSTSIVNDPSLGLVPEAVEMPCPFVESVGIYGSCNGLLFLHGTREENKRHGYIWNPCTKEYRKLPTPPSIDEHLFGGIKVYTYVCNSRNMSSSGFCGFGYDRISDEYKILYHDNRVGHLPGDVIRKRSGLVSVTEFKLYTLGSDTWKNITDNPYRSLFFGCPWKNIGLLVNGALHWIMSSVPSSRLSSTSSLSSARNAKIISFDMEKESFGELQKPPCFSTSFQPPCFSTSSPKEEEYYYRELQVLQECLCLCQSPKFNSRIQKLVVEIWMLKDYTVKDSWTKLFTVFLSSDLSVTKYLKLFPCFENGIITVGGHPNKSLVVHEYFISDLIKISRCRFVEKIYESTQNRWTHEVIHRESLVSINSGTYTTVFS